MKHRRVGVLVSGRASQLDAEPEEERTGSNEQIRAELVRLGLDEDATQELAVWPVSAD